ncbi:MAG: FAD-dependent oxidoreductase [Candidatus Pacebacteria bacterium]|nr:FAD-dependent oxidoreductase [Candidatus Paceibacterota bacterium]
MNDIKNGQKNNVIKNVVIIGAGLAGLSAAHELLKEKRNIKVTIVEALERVGGRVHTPLIDGVRADVGGFMIFPFYKELKLLLKELGLEKKLQPISDKQFFRLSGSNWVNANSLLIWKTTFIKLFIKNFKVILSGKVNYYEPNLNIFPKISAYELLSSAGVKKDFIAVFETLIEAYTYPPLKEMPAALILPVGFKLLFHGMFNKCKVLIGGTNQLIKTLEKTIKEKGANIMVSSPVEKINKNHLILESGLLVEFDDLIITSPLPNELIEDKKLKEDFPYTHCDFIVAKLSSPVQICGENKWFIGYQQGAANKARFTSFAQMSSFTNLSDEYLGGWLMWPEGEIPGDIQSVESISRDLIAKAFTDNRIVNISHMHRWRLTMPDVNIETLKEFGRIQGENNIWLAGDYLGFPSMDTAVYSGKKAAKNILTKY